MTARNLRVWIRERPEPIELNVPSPKIVQEFDKFLQGGNNALSEESPPSFHLEFDPAQVVAMQFGSLDGDESVAIREAFFFLKGRSHPLDVLVYDPKKLIEAYQNHLTVSKNRAILDRLDLKGESYFAFCIDLSEVAALIVHQPGKFTGLKGQH
jgi:hypothetical protein